MRNATGGRLQPAAVYSRRLIKDFLKDYYES
jgi:hypothetical protein